MSPLKPKSLALACGALLLAIPSAFAGPRVAGGDLIFEGTIAYTDTNKISPRAYSPSDTYMTFTPTFRYSKETTENILNATLSLPIRRYDESDFLDSDSVELGIGGEIPFGAGPKLSGSWSINYFDGVRSNYDTARNLNTNSLNINLYADYLLRNKLSLRARAGMADRESKGLETEDTFENSNKTDYYAIGLHARELIRSRIGAYIEYRIQNRETQDGFVDEDDSGLNFGITGQVLPEQLFPKLEADLSFGFASVSRNGGSRNRLTLDGSLAYPLNSKTNVALRYSRNFAITDDDRSIERGNLDLTLDYTPNQKLSFSTGLALQSRDYLNDPERGKENSWTALARANYFLKQNWFTSLQFNYRDASSDIVLRDYSFGTVSLSTTFVY